MLLNSSRRRSPLRGALLVASVALHAALITAGVVLGLLRIDEVEPPAMVIRVWQPPPFPRMAEAPPPALRDPPGDKAKANKPAGETVQPVAARPVAELPPGPSPEDPGPMKTAAPEGPATDAPPAGPGGPGGPGGPAGPGGGKPGGDGRGACPGCTADGKGDGGQERVTLNPKVALGRRIHAAAPEIPEAVRRLGGTRRVLIKVCVSVAGEVVGVTVLAGDVPGLDDAVVAAARQWRFLPYEIEGRPVPFCTAYREILELR